MADLRWNDVRASFNDTNQGIGNAVSAYSNVGNIFGNLRKSILDEEQRAKDNEFRDKQMDENIRQFDLRLGFDAVKHKDDMAYKDKTFEENKRQFGLNYDQKEREMQLSHQARMAGIAIQKAGLNLNIKKFEREAAQDDASAKIIMDVANQATAESNTYYEKNIKPREEQIKQLDGVLGNANATPEEKANAEKAKTALTTEIDQFKNERKKLISGTSITRAIELAHAQAGIKYDPKRNPFNEMYENEKALAVKSVEQSLKTAGENKKDINSAASYVAGLNLTEGAMGQLTGVISKARQIPELKDLSSEALTKVVVNAMGGTYNGYLDTNGRQEFHLSDSDINAFMTNPNANTALGKSLRNAVGFIKQK